ncbi:MAG: ThiF family adenylyltransferase [Sphaerochaetaceae bacterium]|nr:ThiF family adenylyltransferase [Sphaerochaetaceae bacterium]
MIDSKFIKNILLGQRYIADINIKELSPYKNHDYLNIIYCSLEVKTDWVPIVIGIPKNWETNLFDIYLNLKELPFIPHIDRNGKLCLFEFEGILFDLDFEGLLSTCILKARDIIYDGLNKNNSKDFILEFDSYLKLIPNIRIAQVSIPNDKKNQKIKYSEKGKALRGGGESYKDYLIRKQFIKLFASNESLDFSTWNLETSIKNGAYFYIDVSSFIYPPDYRNFQIIDFLNNLLSYVDIKDFQYILKKCKREYLFVFEIHQKKDLTNFFGVLITGAEYEYTNSIVKLRKCVDITPVQIERIDKEFLTNRTSQEENLLTNKSILLIGCGSIGGYVFFNLIKSGCEDITLVDFDLFKNENIYRHLLGVESVGIKKVDALKQYAKKTLPKLKIKTMNEKIELLALNKNNDFDFDNYDYVISATGNHNVNKWLNKYASENSINTSFFYIWNEPLDLGCHVAFINHKKQGCYECLFDLDINENVLYDKASYCAPNQEFTKNVSGCGGTFIPYGSSISLKSSLLFMDCFKKAIYNKLNNNFIASEKGDDYYYKKAGFKVSEGYISQKNKIEIIEGDNFFNDKCKICGKR